MSKFKVGDIVTNGVTVFEIRHIHTDTQGIVLYSNKETRVFLKELKDYEDGITSTMTLGSPEKLIRKLTKLEKALK